MAGERADALVVLREERHEDGSVGGPHVGESLPREGRGEQFVPALGGFGEEEAGVLEGGSHDSLISDYHADVDRRGLCVLRSAGCG